MFLYSVHGSKSSIHKKIKSITQNSFWKKIRKGKSSPQNCLFTGKVKNTETFFFAPLKASLTLEASLVLPLFLFVMITVLQYGRCMDAAVQLGTALADTGKSMAAAAYITTYGGETDGMIEAAAGALSAAAAQHQVFSKTSDTSCIKNANMLLSSFLEENEMINLVLTYQIRTPIGTVGLPWNFFIQCACVRAWVGRTLPSSDSDSSDASDASEYVYVTITGSVYHEDPECTHLKLSVQEISASDLGTRRNNSGEIYHICEKCGNFGSSTVYITNEGNRYHSSLSCSGLKRTVRRMTKEQASHLRSCSKCGKHEN